MNKRRIFLSGIPKEITKNDIIDYFKYFSEVISCEISFDEINNSLLGFGIIILLEPSKVPNIILTQPHIIKGYEIYCQENFPKNFPLFSKNFSNENVIINKKKYQDNHHYNKKIFIGGLPYEATKKDLINFFQRYGEIEHCIINTDIITDKPRGFGFINFKSPFSVNLCLKDSSNHFILGKWVECKKAKPSQGRKKHFIEKISYPTYESTNIKKQNIKLKNNFVLRSLNNNNFYKEPAYFNDNHILQKNLFVYQDNDFNQSDYNSDGLKEKNFEKEFTKKNNENYNVINSKTKLQNFKNDLKGKFNTINDEQNIMEIDTNSSSSNNINSNCNKKNKSIFQKIKSNFNQNQKKSNNDNFLIEENNMISYINSNNFHNKKNENINETKKSLSYSMLPNKNSEKQNIINEKDNWDLSNNITNSTKEMFQNYFNNLKDPQNYNYFHYKLFDVNGEDISNLSSYQNNTKINLFKNNSLSKSDKDSDSNSGSNSNSNSNNNSNKNKSSSTDNVSQKIKNNIFSSSDNQTISKNSNSNKSNSKSNSQHSNNSCERSDSNSLKNSGSNSDSNSGNSGKNSNSNQNSGDSNQNSKESKTPSNNYKYKKHYKKSKSDNIIVSLTSELINYNKDSE